MDSGYQGNVLHLADSVSRFNGSMELHPSDSDILRDTLHNVFPSFSYMATRKPWLLVILVSGVYWASLYDILL